MDDADEEDREVEGKDGVDEGSAGGEGKSVEVFAVI